MSRKSVKEVSILGTEKRRFPNKHYVYVVQVTWTTGATNKIYRRYSQLFEFQLSLIAHFPVQGGKKNPEERTIPFLPGKKLFGRSHIRDVAEERLAPITEYLQALISLAPEVSASQIVTNFFEPTDEDIKPIREKQKRTVRGNEVHEISDPILLEQWVVIGDFEKGKRTECSLKEGDIVDVIEKKASGWWFVDNGGNKGWVPASYLESATGKHENEVERCAHGEEEEYITNNSYIAQSPDELGFDRGVVILVLQKNYDGWWLCRYQRREGLIPAAYLEPNTQDVDRQDERDKRIHTTLPASASLNLINSKADSPSSNSVKYNYKSIDVKQVQPTASIAAATQQFIPRRNSVRQTSIRKRKEKEWLGSFDERIPEGRIDLFVALSDYEATESDGLSFKEGETIEVIEKQDSGWWWGTLRGRDGWVPSSYLESSRRGTGGGSGDTQDRNLKSKRCTAKEQFNGNMKDTLSFRVGEVFELIEKSETGWWYVQNQSGKEGWAPQDLLTEGVNIKPKRQAPPSPTKTVPQSVSSNHLSSVNTKPAIPVSKSFNIELKEQLKPVTPNKPIQPEKPVLQNTQVTKPVLPSRHETAGKPAGPEIPVLQNTQVTKPVLPSRHETAGKPAGPEIPVLQNTQVTKPVLPSRHETAGKPAGPEIPVLQNTQVTKPVLPSRHETAGKPAGPEKPLLQNTQVTKPVLPSRYETAAKPAGPEKPVLPTSNQNAGTQNSYKPIKIGSVGNDKPVTPGKPSYAKVKIGVSGAESNKPSLPTRSRPNLSERQIPASENKPLVTSKPKPDEGNVQNELASLLAKRMQTSTKPSLPVTNKPSEEMAAVKPVLAAPKLSEPVNPVLPSRPCRPTGNPNKTNSTNSNNSSNSTNSTNGTNSNINPSNPSNSTNSKYTTVEDCRAYDEGCLSFRKGENAEVIEKGDSGWWLMRIRNDEGWVFKDKVKLERGAPPIPETVSVGPVALEDFRAEYEDSISFKKGDRLQIIETDSGSGWTWVRVGKKEGWVPTDMISECK